MTRIRMGLVPGLLLALMLAVAACGSGKSNGVASLGGANKPTATTSPGGSSDPQQAALAYARCMRQHINMPDPKIDSTEGIGKVLPRGVSPDDPKFKAAQQACQQYAPNGGQPPKVSPQQQQQMLALARCMRQHGINMPDPDANGGIDMTGAGVDPDGPKFKAAQQACQQYQPKGSKPTQGKQGNGGGSK
jgi:hypothetical protein